VARAVVAQTFDVALRLLHPVTPFITETLWRRFPGRPDDASIGVAPWPKPDRRAIDAEATTAFGMVQELVSAARAIRAEYSITPRRAVSIWVSRSHPAFKEEAATIQRLAKVETLHFGEHPKEPGGHARRPRRLDRWHRRVRSSGERR